MFSKLVSVAFPFALAAVSFVVTAAFAVALASSSCATVPEPASVTSGLTAYCNPPCTAAQRCIQLSSPPGHLLPPICVAK